MKCIVDASSITISESKKCQNKWKQQRAKYLAQTAKKNIAKRRLQFLIGYSTVLKGIKETEKTFLTTSGITKYWGKKVAFPTIYHSNSHGERR
jgi:hypothetical protein